MKTISKTTLLMFFLLILFFENVFAMDAPSLPITYNGNTYSQAIRYYSESGGEHTCYFENGSVVAGYIPGYFWISHSRRYDPDGICGGTYESSGQLAVNLGSYNVDCPADQNIFSSIPLTVPSGWGSSYQQCNYVYGIGDPFPAPAQAVANVVLSPAVGGVATLPQGDGVWCGIDGHYVCQVSFDQNSEVTFEAYPQNGWTFAYWDDGTTNYTNNPQVFTMDSSKTITAVFQTENSSVIVPPDLPLEYSGITFNSAFAWIDTNDVYHACYFKDPVLNSINYPTGYIGVNNQARYALNGSDCGGTYLSPGGGLITFHSSLFKSPIADNVYWSGGSLHTKSWWSYPWILGNYEFTGADQQIYPFASTPFSFPLDKDCSGIPCTPYTVPVSAAMDQTTLGAGAVYGAGEDSEVETFEGEAGNIGPYSGSTCYRKSDNTAFGVSFNYVGTDDTGGENYLCYDAHPGYDYPSPCQTTQINAPAQGTLCVATTYTSERDPSNVWRNESYCDTIPSVVTTRWQDTGGYNTFYIIHEGLYINGSTNDYVTVFLHSDDLESDVRDEIEEKGYAEVSRNQHIAQVGCVGSPGACHMHFEVYRRNGENWNRVDPYGDGTNNILWEQN